MEVDPASFNASRCSPDVSGGSPKNLYRTPRQSVSPLYRGLLCARLGGRNTAGSGRAAEGRRLDAESRTEAPLRHLPGPRATAIKCVNIRLEKVGALSALRAVVRFLCIYLRSNDEQRPLPCTFFRGIVSNFRY